MSGHSKWSNIKHKKEATDKKRAQIFSKLSRAISVAAKDEPNPDFNPILRAIIDKARKQNMPNDKIDRAIKKSSEIGNLKELLIEGYDKDGTAMIIQATTDNSNRTVSEIKKIFKDHNAKWADPGSVLWAFEKTDDGYDAKFPQKISEQSKKTLMSLTENLDDHDDVDEIYTNAIFNDIDNDENTD